jgi:3-oxoacyl-[acyl-carrier protein] reductase
MDLQLKGKRALITGSTSGMGIDIAKLLSAEGAIVVVHGRDRARGERVVEDIRKSGGEASLVLGDLSHDDQADRVGDEVMARLGGIDILVNNAAHTGEGHFDWLDEPIEHWLLSYQSKPLAAVRMIKRFLPGMIERGWGRIINNGSAAAVQPVAGQPGQFAAYAAMLNISAGLARSLPGTGVTANTVSPGLILTPAVETWAKDLGKKMGWAEDWETVEKNLIGQFLPLPVSRIGRGFDIAYAVAFLASPLSGFITGINLRVDGGQVQCV